MEEIKLTHGQVALVDDEDYERVMAQGVWHAQWNPRTKNYRARSRISGKLVYMHRFILNASPRQHVDHRNHRTLDNRRNNLRTCTNAENSRNRRKRQSVSSQYKGVDWDKARNKWRAQVKNNGKGYTLGRFADEVDAARAYNEAAAAMFGEFALLNEVTHG